MINSFLFFIAREKRNISKIMTGILFMKKRMYLVTVVQYIIINENVF